jgi:hypothetical protein
LIGNRKRRFKRAAAAGNATDSQPLAAQGVAATARFAGQVRLASGANYFPGHKPLRRKGLRHNPRQEYESDVDKCLELSIMAGAKK